jgi:hypothetical protein
MFKFKIENMEQFKKAVTDVIAKVSTETFGWIAVVLLHAATIPSLMAVMSGLTDRMPPVDLVLLVWAGLTMLFIKATVQKDMLNVVTIGLGFIIQATMIALIFFK